MLDPTDGRPSVSRHSPDGRQTGHRIGRITTAIGAARARRTAARAGFGGGAMSVGDMCKAAVELSDNTCANLLLAQVGGPAALTAFWRSTGDAVTRLDHNEPMLNRSPPGQSAGHDHAHRDGGQPTPLRVRSGPVGGFR